MEKKIKDIKKYVEELVKNEADENKINLLNELVASYVKKEIIDNDTDATDWYEYTMDETYYNFGIHNMVAYFDLFFRKNPFNGGYTITNGLDNIIDFINNFKFTDDIIEHMREKGTFSDEYLEHLRGLEFKGDVYAIPDGTPVFPNEPIITVRAPIEQAQALETALLANFNHGALVTTGTKRMVKEAGGRPIGEGGLRRARGKDSGIEASKYAFIGGCVGTSNTKAARIYGLPVMGTMGHSMIGAFDTEYEAFMAYAKTNPNNCIFLVDTYDTLKSGIPNAIRVAKEYLIPNGYPFKGIRIDSGDLVYLSKMARQMLDDAGFPDAKICLSNGLDEYSIRNYINNGAEVDTFLAGDNIIAPKERVGGVYKLVAIEKNGEIIPKVKVSGDTVKTTNPGYKKVYRFFDQDTHKVLGDVIAVHDEVIPKDKYTLVDEQNPWKKTKIEDYFVRELQVPIFINGKQVYKQPSIYEIKQYCSDEFDTLTDRITDITNPHTYYVDLSEKEKNLKEYMLSETVKNAAETAIENNDYAKVIGGKK